MKDMDFILVSIYIILAKFSFSRLKIKLIRPLNASIIFFQFGATASVGLSGIQSFKNHEVSRRVSDNDGEIATLQTNLAATCAKVLVNWDRVGLG